MTSLALTLTWLAVALAAAWAWRRRRAPGGAPLAIAALLLASLHRWQWNRPLYEGGRRWLIDTGLYEQRLLAKLAVGAAAVALALFAARPLLRWLRTWPAALRVAGGAALVDAAFVAVRTLSIDGWIPDAVNFDPGKTALQLALATTALVAALRSRPTAQTPRGPTAFYLQ